MIMATRSVSLSNADRLNRVASFDYSWSIYRAAHLLSAVELLDSDVLVDPFVGCGTTAVLAGHLGLNSVSCDICPLAAFTSQCKIKLMTGKWNVDWWSLRDRSAESIVKSLIQPPREVTFGDEDIERFLGVACLTQVKWLYEGGKASRESLDRAFITILTELSGYARDRDGSVRGRHSVVLGSADSLQSDMQGRHVMLASPPFPSSNENPQRRQLGELLRPSFAYRTAPASQGGSILTPRQLTMTTIAKAKELHCDVAIIEVAEHEERNHGAELRGIFHQHGFKVTHSCFYEDNGEKCISLVSVPL